MITRDSTLQEVYAHPVGKDLLNRLLDSIGRGSKMIENPVTGNLKLGTISNVFGKEAGSMVDTIISLTNMHPEMPPPSTDEIIKTWWKEAVVYQVYPRSFQDSNGDGVGDLNGIKQRIPYLKELGIDVLWLSPIYDSPNDDNGYDIRDYKKIMKEFGTMKQFDELLAELHKNDIKLIMDLVINHTSDEHKWFKEAAKSPDSPYKDYYIWQKGKSEDVPPNNWKSFFAGDTWNYYPEHDEWALHLFSKKQMDLNWENPKMRHELYDMINWWLEKGIDGFRLDVINLISKATLADGNETVGRTMGFQGIEHYFYGPRLHEHLREMRRETFSKHDVFTVGETPGMGMEMSKMLSAEERKELDLVFNFDAFDMPGESRYKPYLYDLKHLKKYFLNWQQNFGNNCWQSLVFENHDCPRMTSKVDPSNEFSREIAKLIAVLQLTLKGTPFIYQGQELGAVNTKFSDLSQLRDVDSINRYNQLLERKTAQEAFELVSWGSRDHSRTPMHWDASEHAGFTTGEPWIDVNPTYTRNNALAQQQDEGSVFSFFKTLIALRKTSNTLVYGDFAPVFVAQKHTFCYFRIAGNEKFYVEINLTDKTQKRPGEIFENQELVAGNYRDVSDMLRPYEANVYRCS